MTRTCVARWPCWPPSWRRRGARQDASAAARRGARGRRARRARRRDASTASRSPPTSGRSGWRSRCSTRSARARGTLVTRGFPLDPRPGERVDHPHHVGLWFNYGDVNGVDFWNNSERARPQRAGEDGPHPAPRDREASGGAARASWWSTADWQHARRLDGCSPSARASCSAPSGESASIDRVTELDARASASVASPTTRKASSACAWRARSSSRPTSRRCSPTPSGKPTPVPVLDNTGVTGVYTSSEGLTGAKVWGTRGRWTALAGQGRRRGRRAADARPPEEPRLPDLLARARLRPVRRQPARARRLQQRQGDAELQRSRPAPRPPSATAARAPGPVLQASAREQAAAASSE